MLGRGGLSFLFKKFRGLQSNWIFFGGLKHFEVKLCDVLF